MSTKKNIANNKKENLYNELKNKAYHALGISVIAISIFCIMAVYGINIGGLLGIFINNILIGFFGIGAYIIPVYFIYIGIFIFLDKRKDLLKNIYLSLGVILCISVFVNILTFDENYTYISTIEYISDCYNNASAYNGGLLGGIIGIFLSNILGEIGSYIIILTSLSILIMFMLTDEIKDKFYKLAEDFFYKEDNYSTKNLHNTKQNSSSKVNSRKKLRYTKSKGLKHKKVIKEEIILIDIDTEELIESNKISLLKEEVEYENNKSNIIINKHKNYDKYKTLNNFQGEKIFNFSEYDDILGYQKIQNINNFFVEHKSLNIFMELNLSGNMNNIIEDEAVGTLETNEIKEVHQIDEESSSNKPTTSNLKLYNEEKVANLNQNKHIVKKEISYDINSSQLKTKYNFPIIELLNKAEAVVSEASEAQLIENSKRLEETLKSFGVNAKVIEVSEGPTVTRYEVSPGHGVKVSKIANLADDLALNLSASGIRIEAPIPGKPAVGIEVPNKDVTPVFLSEVLKDSEFKNFPSNLAFGVGKDIAGKTVVADIAKMPHMLIAGATGSGKSVCINTLIVSLIYKSSPDDVKLLMIDPKVVELSIYNGIPHLLIPVVTEPKKAAGALNWAVSEMTSRYNFFAENSVRDLKGYNEVLMKKKQNILPQIVIIIDELSDLMMASADSVESSICRLAQMARAAGIHLIIATQRPSVDVITGLIKANIPSRLAFSVSSGIDSRTILDSVGAEKLLGKGDMLFFPSGMSKPQRIQGAFISDKEVEKVVKFVKNGQEHHYNEEMIQKITCIKTEQNTNNVIDDEIFLDVLDFIVKKDKASASMIQRQFRVGYNRASRIIENLENYGIISFEDGSKPRKILMNDEEILNWKTKNLTN